VNLPVTNIPGCVSRNSKTLGLQHLQLTDVGVGSGPPDRACVVHHRTDELLVEQHAFTLSRGPVFSGERCRGIHSSIRHFYRSPGHYPGVHHSYLSEAELPAVIRPWKRRFPLPAQRRGPNSGLWPGCLLGERSLTPSRAGLALTALASGLAPRLLLSAMMSRFSCRKEVGEISPRLTLKKTSSSVSKSALKRAKLISSTATSVTTVYNMALHSRRKPSLRLIAI
jgi:hypothetical protein